jgi:TonB family protein
MKRYIHAFTVTLIVYLLAAFALMYHAFLIHKPSSPDMPKEVMAITLYEAQKEESKVLPTPMPPVPTRPLLKTPQKSVLKKEPKVLERQHSVQEQMIVSQESEQPTLEKLTRKEEIKVEATTSEISHQEALHVKQKEYLENLKKRINEHKTYPKIAQNSHIEGRVMIEFTISPKGELLSFTILEGKKIFHKATEEAVQKSFPFLLSEDLFTSMMTFQIELSYTLL